MTLRKKTIAIISITLAGLLLILFAVSQGIMLNSFSEMEVEDTSKNVERAQSALSDDISNLNAIVGDWAPWDDTYAFVDDVNNSYIENNLNDYTLANLRVNLILFVNPSGQIVFGKAMDLQNGQEVPVPEGLNGSLAESNLLTYHADAESQVSGLLLLPEGPMLIASHPILPSQREGPIRGALIMGRSLDPAEIGRLAETTQLSLAVQRLDESQMASDFEAARSSLSGDTTIFVKPLDKNSVAGYTLLNDVYGNPAMMLRVDLPREIYQHGQTSQLYFIGSIIVVGLIFGLVVLLLLGKLVLSPLSRLSAAVGNIGKTGALSVRVPTAGKNELSSLSNDINGMLESLERSHNELQESGEKFKHLVEDMNDGYFVVQDLRIVFANARSAEMFGHSIEEVIGSTVEKLLPPDEVEKLSELYLRTLRGEAVKQQYETTFTRDDGTTVTVEFGPKRMYYAGRPAVSVLMRDITKRRQMEEALRESEQKYRDVVERAHDMVAIVQDEIVKYINNRSSEMIGYMPKEMIGTPIAEYIHPNESKRTLSDYEQLIRGEHSEPIYETTLLHKDGTQVDVEASMVPITYAGKPAELVIVRDITERRRAQERLRQSEEHYSTLVKSLTDAVFKLRGKLIIWCNDRVEEIYGYKRDELIGEQATMLIPEGVNSSKFVAEVAVAMDKHGYYRGAHRVKRKDGSLVDIEYTVSKIPNDELIELIVVARDITGRRRMENALRESEEKYRLYFEHTSDVIYSISLEGKILTISPAVERGLGYKPEELIGKDMVEAGLATPETFERAAADVARVLEGEQVTATESEFIAKDGTRRFGEVSAAPVFSSNGEAVSIICVARDVTERRKMEDALRRSEQNYRKLFDNTIDGMFVLDAETMRIVFANQVAAKFYGFDTVEEGLGMNPLDFLYPDERERAVKVIAEDMFEKDLHEIHEFRTKTKDGRERWISVVGTKTEYQGKPAGLISFRDTTEWKQMEDALRKREGDYRVLFDSVLDGLVVMDVETMTIMLANESAARMAGFDSPQDLTGAKLQDHFPPEESEKAYKILIEEVLWKDLPYHHEYHGLTKNGKDMWIYAVCTRIEYQGKMSVLISIHDITERMQMEDALKESEQNYRFLFNSSLDGLLVLDAETMTILLANESAARMTGVDSPQSFVGAKLQDYLPPEERERAHKILNEDILEKDLRNNYEYHGFNRDGKELWINAIITKTEYQGKMAVFISMHDVTERRKAEDALRESEQNYRTLFNSIPDGLVVMDTETKTFVLANESTARMAGLDSPQNLIGLKPQDYLSPEEWEKAHKVISDGVLEKDSHTCYEYHVFNKDGKERWLNLASTRTEYQGKMAALVSFQDVTERKQAEDKLKQTMTELARSNTELERFAYVASHDLQEPLRMVASYTQLLARRYKGKLDSDADDFIGYAVDGANRMQQLINALLDYSRVGTRGKPFAPTSCENILYQAVANLQAAIKANDAVVTHDDLPTVMADTIQMVQLFQNLIGNAIKFHSDRQPEVHIGAERNGTAWIFSVRDNGIGIDPQYFDRIFIIFQRLHSREQYPGTGIGLAICKKIIERHKGRIWVESQPGKGATFYFTIPIKEEEKP